MAGLDEIVAAAFITHDEGKKVEGNVEQLAFVRSLGGGYKTEECPTGDNHEGTKANLIDRLKNKVIHTTCSSYIHIHIHAYTYTSYIHNYYTLLYIYIHMHIHTYVYI